MVGDLVCSRHQVRSYHSVFAAQIVRNKVVAPVSEKSSQHAECLVGGKYWRKMSPTNPFFCSRTFSCGHGDLLHVPGAADLIESEGRREVPVSLDLRLQIGDLLLRGGNGIGTGDKAVRRWFLTRHDHMRWRHLRRITGLPAT